METKFRIFMIALLFGAAASFAMGLFGHHAKWFGSVRLMLDIAGIIQLELSGVFEKVFTEYNDVEKYPGGPPSRITRQIIDDPYAPVRTWLRNTFFFEHGTGIKLIIAGFVFQLLGVWVPN
jgi:hypothetical protein